MEKRLTNSFLLCVVVFLLLVSFKQEPKQTTTSVPKVEPKILTVSFAGDVSTSDYWEFNNTPENIEQRGRLVDYKIAYYTKKGFKITHLNVINGGVNDVIHVVMEKPAE